MVECHWRRGYYQTIRSGSLVGGSRGAYRRRRRSGISPSFVQLVTAVTERLMDPVEAVRAAACTALCAAATADPAAVPRAAIAGGAEEGGGVCGRLRDKKGAVRAAAAVGLVSVFRARCSSGTDGERVEG